jgi:hypothetical protein
VVAAKWWNSRTEEVIDFQLASEKAAEQASFKASLPDGVTVELVGVCEYPSEGKQWWRPDGSSIVKAPCETSGGQVFPGQGEQGREFVVNVGPKDNQDTSFVWQTVPAGSSCGLSPYREGQYRKDLKAFAVSLPVENDTVILRVGLAHGAWKTLHSKGPKGTESIGRELFGMTFSEAVQSLGKVFVTVSDDIEGQIDRRIIAIDNTGDLHTAAPCDTENAGKVHQTTATFENLLLQDIKEFQFQTRPYEWVTFKNVSLKPGKKTDVQIESEGGSPASMQAAKVWQAIQLVGVCPDGGDDLLDAEGKLIGKSLGLGPRGSWGPDSQARTLVFDIPQTPELQWATFPELYVSGTGRRLGGGMTGQTASFEGKKRRILALTIDRTYQKSGWLRNRTVAIDRIDVTLKYYLPGRREAMCTFLGPFETEKSFRPQEGQDCALKLTKPIVDSTGDWTTFRISAGIDFDDKQVLAYDTAGKRYLVESSGGKRTVSGKHISVEHDYYIRHLPFSRLAAITLGEKPEEKTFRNILVRYPDRPARDYPEYLDKLASTLGLAGLSPEQLWRYDFKSADEALKVIDIVRGNHIERAWQVILFARTDFAALPQDVQDKLRRTAKTWADNGNFQGFEMGLKGQWPEFVAPALEMLHEDTRFRGEVAHGLQFYHQLTPQELDQIVAVLEQRDDPRRLDELLQCLRNNRRRPGGQEALLRLARSEKVWLWWPALDYLTESEGLTLGQLTRDLQVKQLARTNPELGGNPARAAEARALLAKLPSAQLATMSTGTLSEVIRSATTNLPRADAQAVLLNLLQDRVDHWWDYEVEGYSPSKWWAIDRAVRQLNNWNNLNLGGVGQDMSQETSDHLRIDWPALAKEVLTHFGRTSATQPGKKTDVEIEAEANSLGDEPAKERAGNLPFSDELSDRIAATLGSQKLSFLTDNKLNSLSTAIHN